MSLEKLRKENMKKNANLFSDFHFNKMIDEIPEKAVKRPKLKPTLKSPLKLQPPRRSSRPRPEVNYEEPKMEMYRYYAYEDRKPRRPSRRSARAQKMRPVTYDEDKLEEAVFAEEHKPMTFSKCLKEANGTSEYYNLVNKLFRDLYSKSTWHADTDGQEEESLAMLAKRMRRLRVGESCKTKMIKTHATSMAFHPMAEKALLMVGGRGGDLGFWEASKPDTAPIVMKPHLSVVSMVATHPDRMHQVVTTSYDGAVRITDINQEMVLAYGNRGTMVYSMDFLSPDSILRGENDGFATVTDFREDQDEKGLTLKCRKTHLCTLTAISVNPQRQHLVSIATNAYKVLLWDIRNPDKCLVDLPHGKTVQWCEFSAQGNSLLTSSSTDEVRIYDTDRMVLIGRSGGVVKPDRNIYHDNNTGDVPFRPRWFPHREDCFIIGSMAQPRRIEVFNAKSGEALTSVTHALLNTVNPMNEFHPSLNILATVDSAGDAHAFSRP